MQRDISEDTVVENCDNYLIYIYSKKIWLAIECIDDRTESLLITLI